MLLNLPGTVWGMLIGLAVLLLLPLAIIWIAYRYFR
jgi:cbb3-type cytochrome oxidase subunit 3